MIEYPKGHSMPCHCRPYDPHAKSWSISATRYDNRRERVCYHPPKFGHISDIEQCDVDDDCGERSCSAYSKQQISLTWCSSGTRTSRSLFHYHLNIIPARSPPPLNHYRPICPWKQSFPKKKERCQWWWCLTGKMLLSPAESLYQRDKLSISAHNSPLSLFPEFSTHWLRVFYDHSDSCFQARSGDGRRNRTLAVMHWTGSRYGDKLGHIYILMGALWRRG